MVLRSFDLEILPHAPVKSDETRIGVGVQQPVTPVRCQLLCLVCCIFVVSLFAWCLCLSLLASRELLVLEVVVRTVYLVIYYALTHVDGGSTGTPASAPPRFRRC